MYVLDTKLAARDAFVVAVRNAFQKAGVVLGQRAPGQTGSEDSVVHLEMQVDRVTAGVILPLANPPRRMEFLEENPDMLEIALADTLKRHLRKPTAT
jgi:hypothetical protein